MRLASGIARFRVEMKEYSMGSGLASWVCDPYSSKGLHDLKGPMLG